MNNSNTTTEVQLLRQRASQLPKGLMSLITDGALDVAVFDIVEKYHLTKEQMRLLENEIILTLLRFLSLEDLSSRIQESLKIDTETAENITTELHANLFQEAIEILNEHPPEEGSELAKQKELSELQEKLAQAKATAEEAPTANTPTPPAKTAAVQPMRTMETDMDRIHGYGAYRAAFPNTDEIQENEEEAVIKSVAQEELLSTKPPLTDMPSYDEGDTPKEI